MKNPTGTGEPGRPKEFDEIVSVRLPKELHNEMSVEALRRGVYLATVIRERLERSSSTGFVSQN